MTNIVGISKEKLIIPGRNLSTNFFMNEAEIHKYLSAKYS